MAITLSSKDKNKEKRRQIDAFLAEMLRDPEFAAGVFTGIHAGSFQRARTFITDIVVVELLFGAPEECHDIDTFIDWVYETFQMGSYTK